VQQGAQVPRQLSQGHEKRPKRLLIDCLNKPQNIDAFVSTRIAAMEEKPIMEILLPITGINLKVPEWILAPDVRLLMMTPERFEADIIDGYIRGATNGMPNQRWASGVRPRSGRRPSKVVVGGTVLAIRAEGDE
jgi:hypothetical protein